MENRKLIKLLIPIFVLGFFVFNNPVFAYDVETHAFLTSEIVKFYNQNFSNQQIPDELKSYLIDGSRREDDFPRWMNHFYDPVYDRGLTYDPKIDFLNLGNWQKSKDWAQDSNNQNSLTYKVPATIASILTAIQQRAISTLTTETDFTWQKAIKFYVNGDKEKALFTLGHVLHLIEDKAVPDHTRNDPHPGDSPYENYVQQLTLNNPDKNLSQRLKNKQPIILDNLNSYFDELANYSNNNFYSKDTIGIQSGYKTPEPDYFEILNDGRSYGMYEDKEFGNYPIVKAKGLLEVERDELLNRPLIMSSYYSRLSTKSVQHGAGVINLFFQEVEKAKNDPNFQKELSKSVLARVVSAVSNFGQSVASTGKALTSSLANALKSAFTNTFGNTASNGEKLVEVVDLNSLQNNGKKVSNETSAPTISQQENKQANFQQTKQIIDEEKETEEQKIQQKEQKIQQPEQQKQQIKKETQQEQVKQTQKQTTQTTKTTNFKECSFGTSKSPSREKVLINEVAWMGGSSDFGLTSADEWIELKNISGAEVDVSNWQLIDKAEQIKINLGLIKNTKIKAGQFILLERTDDDSVPNITADLIYSNTLNNSDEGLRLFDSQCNLIDEVLAGPDWPAGDNTQKRTMERSPDLSWHTYNGTAQNSIFGTPKKESSVPAVVYSGGGGNASVNNQQPTTTPTSTSSPAKILISEVQITGGTGKTEKDFIELYNPNNFQVNLNGYRLVKRTKTGASDTSIKSWTSDAYIPANGYYLWANSGYTDIPATPDITTTATISNDNGVAIRFGSADTGTVIDSIAWGEAQNIFIEGSVFPINPVANQSIQRKFQNNTFIDTDNNANDFEIQSCPSPKAQSKICQSAQTNQAPSAFFVYTPINPTAGDEITFNAASSIDSDGTIISYQWDFGDLSAGSGQTILTTSATTTHTYSQASNYSVSLIVFDNQNTPSTATSAVISVSVSGSNHVVISEIQAGTDVGSDDEFIELYNPTSQMISLNGWELRKKSSSGSEANLVDNADFLGSIAPKGFFLIAHKNYKGSKTQDLPYSVTSELAYSNNSIVLYNGDYRTGSIIDEVVYTNIPKNQSLERKAFSNNQCVSAQSDGEFLGNGCDTDNNNADFEIRDIPNPQNSLSLPEPREVQTALSESSWNITYDPNTLSINFSWPEASDLTYEIKEYNSPGVSIFNGSSSGFSKKINEVGRKYKFSIQVFDEEGMGGNLIEKEIETPSFIKDAHFYNSTHYTHNGEKQDNLIEFSYDNYPFLPLDLVYAQWETPTNGPNYKALVFYLNKEAPKHVYLNGTAPLDEDRNNVLWVKYKTRCGNDGPYSSLVLPDVSEENCVSGFRNSHMSYSYYLSEGDKHLLLPALSFSDQSTFTEINYFTVAFYGFKRDFPQGTAPMDGIYPNFKLLAVDNTKYYFNNPPNYELPQLTGEITLNFDKQNSKLNVSWPSATDPDTLDALLTYEIKYNSSADWQPVGCAINTTKIVSTGDSFLISVRAKDDFNNYSNTVLIKEWSYPATDFSFTQSENNAWSSSFGYGSGYYGIDGNNINLQSVMPSDTFQFDKVSLRIKQLIVANETVPNDAANLKLSVYPDNKDNNQPDFSSLTASSIISNLYNPDGNSDLTFHFDSPISFLANSKYWLALEVESYADGRGFFRNAWQNAITEINPYLQGEAARVKVTNGVYDSFIVESGSDWYIKIGLEQKQF